jgi:hypothetical protein
MPREDPLPDIEPTWNRLIRLFEVKGRVRQAASVACPHVETGSALDRSASRRAAASQSRVIPSESDPARGGRPGPRFAVVARDQDGRPAASPHSREGSDINARPCGISFPLRAHARPTLQLVHNRSGGRDRLRRGSACRRRLPRNQHGSRGWRTRIRQRYQRPRRGCRYGHQLAQLLNGFIRLRRSARGTAVP